MRAREADHDGFVERGGVKIHYEVHGDGEPTILLLPTWTLIHKRFWKMQLPYLARHFRVVTYDGPGNGESDRPTEPGAYTQQAQVGYALDVLDATGTDRAVVAGLSKGANWVLDLAANHGERVLGAVFIAPGLLALLGDEVGRLLIGSLRPDVDTAEASREDLRNLLLAYFHGPLPDLEPSRVPHGEIDASPFWAKANAAYWLERHEDFLWHFIGQCLTEPHSTKAIEDCVAWGLDTKPEVLVSDSEGTTSSFGNPVSLDAATVRTWCGNVRCPTLVINGDYDLPAPLPIAEILAELTGGELFVVEGGGHFPQGRDPVQVNLAIRDFVERRCVTHRRSRRTWTRGRHRAKRVLYISSPIGLGHAQRDLAIARELRTHHPDAEIHWLAQHPVTRVLDAAGERVHPASGYLANESAHIEDESAEHDLHCFQALRNMDEILLANYMVFHDLVTGEHFDLVVGDESWEVDHFLHENPELKCSAFAWFTDFVGYLPMPDGGEREAYVAADYNAEMIGHIERFPTVRDRAIFVGNLDDIVPHRFGPDLPLIRDWTEEHYDFAGYVTGFDPAALGDREALREELGYGPDEAMCMVTVGGSGVGGDLLRRVIAAFPEAKAQLPGLRMVVVAGPRIDPDSLPSHECLDVRAYVHELYRHLACCDLAIVQGGLSTCMELTATGRPFIYVPLRHHFEQNFHVHHRLQRYGAGRRLDYEDTTPEQLAQAITEEIGRDVAYRSVETDGAARAAGLLAELL